MKSNIISAVRLTIVCLVFFTVIYNLMVLGFAQFSPNKGRGEVIQFNGKTYYANIGQSFTEDKYFNSRPSAASYNAAASCGSNKGPSNPDYLMDVQSRIDSFVSHNPGVSKSEIPSELVTYSGSGLDPHISVQAAKVQIKRISSVRGMSEAQLEKLIQENTERPLLGLFGTEKINVLKLNIALDKQ